ncbi:transposase [Ochrobactrum sp. GPK 3]|uniref:transposase n=1 Tax=Brucella sp. 22210 TaxID=3453892 RepID=UPI0031385C2D
MEILGPTNANVGDGPKRKLAIVNSVGVEGATVTEVALRHDVSRQQIYMWRSEWKRKRLLPPSPEPLFLPVDMAATPLRLPRDKAT